METLSTVLHYYRFDTNEPEQAQAYKDLCENLKAKSLKCMESWTGSISNDTAFYREKIKPLDGKEVSLELKHIFGDQWNSGPTKTSDKGLRLHDWAQQYLPENRWLKTGYWLEQTAEMREIRDNTMTCGYCGHQEPAQKGSVFCNKCIDSEYLKESDLHLLRMLPAAETFGGNRPELSEAEKAHLLPQYLEAQIHGSTERGRKRIAKKRENITAKRNKAIYAANTEHDGFLWLMDHGFNTSNVIYYDHTDRFCFGWRQALGDELLSKVLDLVCEFPFRYTIKTADGRKLENE